MDIVESMLEQKNGMRGMQCTDDADTHLCNVTKITAEEELLFAKNGMIFLAFLKMLDMPQAKDIPLEESTITETMSLAMSDGKRQSNNKETLATQEKLNLTGKRLVLLVGLKKQG